jgi:hypothetical protein
MGSPSQSVVTNPKRSGDPSRRSTTNRDPLGPSVRAQLEGNDGGPGRITQKDAPLPLHQLKLRPRADRRLMPGAHPQPSAAPSDGEDAFGPHQEGPLVRARFRSSAAPRRRRVDVGEPPLDPKALDVNDGNGRPSTLDRTPTPAPCAGAIAQLATKPSMAPPCRTTKGSALTIDQPSPTALAFGPNLSGCGSRISATTLLHSSGWRVLRPAVRWHRSHLAKSSPLVDRPPDGR